jgi:hypothetical protein
MERRIGQPHGGNVELFGRGRCSSSPYFSNAGGNGWQCEAFAGRKACIWRTPPAFPFVEPAPGDSRGELASFFCVRHSIFSADIARVKRDIARRVGWNRGIRA